MRDRNDRKTVGPRLRYPAQSLNPG